jgi:hypothetical protein
MTTDGWPLGLNTATKEKPMTDYDNLADALRAARSARAAIPKDIVPRNETAPRKLIPGEVFTKTFLGEIIEDAEGNIIDVMPNEVCVATVTEDGLLGDWHAKETNKGDSND